MLQSEFLKVVNESSPTQAQIIQEAVSLSKKACAPCGELGELSNFINALKLEDLVMVGHAFSAMLTLENIAEEVETKNGADEVTGDADIFTKNTMATIKALLKGGESGDAQSKDAISAAIE